MELTTALLLLLAVLLVIVGLAGLILPALPGPILVFAGLLLAAWAEDFIHVGTTTLIVLGIMAALAYLLDFIATALGARRSGASGYAMTGATVGAIVGIFFGIPGLLLGPFLGAVIGELLARRNLLAATRAGIGAFIGLVVATAGKVALGVGMIGVYLVVRVF